MSSIDPQEVLFIPPAELSQRIDDAALPDVLQFPPAAAFISYYQRGFSKGAQAIIDRHFRERHQTFVEHPSLDTFPPLQQFNEATQAKIFRALAALEITTGCNAGINAGCGKWCGLDAIQGVRHHIPFNVLEEIVDRHGDMLLGNQTPLYYASDVSDYRDGDKRYKDVERLFEEQCEYRPYVSTVFAKGSEDAMRNVHVHRISIGENTHSLLERGLLEVHQESLRERIHPMPLGLSGGEATKLSPTGIGCFNGLLMNSRGVYFITQNVGVNSAAPQKKLVIPYIGDNPVTPQPGDDIRSVLSQHIPLLAVLRDPLGRHEVMQFVRRHTKQSLTALPNVTFINDPATTEFAPLAVIFQGTKITRVVSPEDYTMNTGSSLAANLESVRASAVGHYPVGKIISTCILWTLLQIDLLERFYSENPVSEDKMR